MNPRPGGDVYVDPSAANAPPPATPPPDNPPPDGEPPAEPAPSGMIAAVEEVMTPKPNVRQDAVIRGVVDQVTRREIAAVEKWAPRLAADPPGWEKWVRAFYQSHTVTLMETLRVELDSAEAYAEEQQTALLAEGVKVIEGWPEKLPERLLAMVEAD